MDLDPISLVEKAHLVKAAHCQTEAMCQTIDALWRLTDAGQKLSTEEGDYSCPEPSPIFSIQ